MAFHRKVCSMASQRAGLNAQICCTELLTKLAEPHHISGGRVSGEALHLFLRGWLPPSVTTGWCEWLALINWLFAQLLSWWCHMIVQGYAPCQGQMIMPPIDFHIPTLLLAMPASRAGFPERMSNILGILREPLLPGTDPIYLWF